MVLSVILARNPFRRLDGVKCRLQAHSPAKAPDEVTVITKVDQEGGKSDGLPVADESRTDRRVRAAPKALEEAKTYAERCDWSVPSLVLFMC